MDRLPIPGDCRAECFPLAKSRLTLAPLIHILLIRILLLTSSTLLAHLRLGLLLILSSNSVFMSFRVEFFHLVYASRVQRTVEKRLNTRYHKIRKDPEVTWEEGTLDPWYIVFTQITESSYKNGSLKYSHWLNPLLMLFKMHSFFFYSFIYHMISVYLIYSKFCSRLEGHFRVHIVPFQIEHPLHS